MIIPADNTTTRTASGQVIDPVHLELLGIIQVNLTGKIFGCPKVKVLQFHLRLPTPIEADQRFQRFLNNYAAATNQGLLALIWLHKPMPKQDDLYHCAAFLNADVVRAPAKICLDIVTSCWSAALSLDNASKLVDCLTKDRAGNPQQNGILIKKNWSDNFLAYLTCDQWIRYFMKAAPPMAENKKRPAPPVGFGAVWTDLTGRQLSGVSSKSGG